jgi:nicotinamide mononucleotide transporter
MYSQIDNLLPKKTMLNINNLEILAVICCFINIYLVARAKILNFVFGSAAVSLYFIIFFQTKLYADMCLQLIFLILQFYGCYQWLSKTDGFSKIFIQKSSSIFLLYTFLITTILFTVISSILSSYTDSTTVYMDSLITSLSLVAQWLMSKKFLIHWGFWMVADIFSIKIYLFKGLYFTSLLYAFLFIICIYGYLNWKKQAMQQV